MGLIAGGVGIAALKVAKVGLFAGLFKFLSPAGSSSPPSSSRIVAGIKRIFTGKPAAPAERDEAPADGH